MQTKATVSDPQATVLELLYGRWRSQTLYAGVKLGIFEVVGGEPMRAAVVARELNLDPALSYRLLRALGSLGCSASTLTSAFRSPRLESC